MGTSGAQSAEVFNLDQETRPGILHLDCVKCLGLTEMTCKGMVMSVLQNTELKIAIVGNVYLIGIAE